MDYKKIKRYFSTFRNYYFFLLLNFVLLCGFGTVSSQEQNDNNVTERMVYDFRQLTTHPDEDLTPRVSPDGKWIAYVSKQSGNYDIWVRSTKGGRAYQITFHKANDYYPAWDYKGRSILFVSQRSDAYGDIWRIKLRERQGVLMPRGDPERLTTYMGFDGYPSCSPDDKDFVWVSDSTGQEEIWLNKHKLNEKIRLTFSGGTQPAWSSESKYIAFTSFQDSKNSNGDIWVMDISALGSPAGQSQPTLYQITKGPAFDGFPSWNSALNQIIFLRYAVDTNGDKVVTFGDRPQIWKADIALNEPRLDWDENPFFRFLIPSFNMQNIRYAAPVTSAANDYMQPYYGKNNRIYFASSKSKNLDIWSVPLDGPVSILQDAEQQLEQADVLFPLSGQLTAQNIGPLFLHWNAEMVTDKDVAVLWDRILAFQRIIDNPEADKKVTAQALYQMGRCYFLLNYPKIAGRLFKIIIGMYPKQRNVVAFAEMALLGLDLKDEPGSDETVIDKLNVIVTRYEDQPDAAAQAQLSIGDLDFSRRNFPEAFNAYSQVLELFSDVRSACAESQLKLGDVYQNFGSRDEVISAYLSVVEEYPEQRQWMIPARNRILNLVYTDNDAYMISRLRELIGQYAGFPLLCAAAQLQIAEILYKRQDYRAAIQEYDLIGSYYPDLNDEVFSAQMGKVRSLLKIGENLRAFTILEQLIEKNKNVHPQNAKKARVFYLEALLQSADELKAVKDFRLALSRYNSVIQLDPENVSAHRGYVECKYYLKSIDQVIEEYKIKCEEQPENNILLYMLGLAYSFKGTEQYELYDKSKDFDTNALKLSNKYILESLSYDYTLIEAYHTLGFNYEMLETDEERQLAKTSSFYKRLIKSLAAPVTWAVQKITFYHMKKPQRYYEQAIHELSKALALNDENENPNVEANLALNLANNYYKLGEYGFSKAYEFYHLKSQYDTTFTNVQQKALIFHRMAHCAYVIEDINTGPQYFLKAIELYKELGDEKTVLLDTKRLALLYQIGNQNDLAVEYFQSAAEIENRQKLYTDLMRSYRSIAHNFLMLDEPYDAIIYARKALDLIQSGKTEEIKTESSRIKIGFLGFTLPVPFFDLNKMGLSASSKFTTQDELALIYTILGESYTSQKDFTQAINVFEEKLKAYQKSNDKLAEATFLNNIGYLYYVKGELQKAWDYFVQSHEICDQKNNVSGILNNTYNMGRIALDLKKSPTENNSAFAKNCLNKSVESINKALDLTSRENLLYPKMRCRLLLLMSEMTWTNENQQNLNAVDQALVTLNSLDQVYYAKTYLDEALGICKTYSLSVEECIANFSLGELYAFLKEDVEAYQYFTQCRKIALRNKYYSLLWRVNTAIGDLVTVMPLDAKRELKLKKDAFEYYSEAIDVLQTQPVLGRIITPDERKDHQRPYRQAIAYLEKIGDTNGALLFTEQMRSKIFYDLIGSENVVLAKERHKIYYGNARFIQQKMNELEVQIIRAKSQTTITPAQIAQLKNELEEYQIEYKELLQKIHDEVPEMETLVRVRTISLPEIQNICQDDQAFVTFMTFKNETFLWIITPFDVFSCSVNVTNDQLKQSLKNYDSTASGEILKKLFIPLTEQAPEVRRVVLVPDEEFLLYPWSYIGGKILNDISSLSVVPSLALYTANFMHRKLGNKTVYYSGSEPVFNVFENLNYETLTPVTSPDPTKSFSLQKDGLSSSDILHLDVMCDWNRLYPALSRFGFSVKRSAPARFNTLQLYQMSVKAKLLNLNFSEKLTTNNESVFLAWEYAFSYAGVPSLLTSLWPSSPESDSLFFSHFYKNLDQYPPAQALAVTQKELVNLGEPAQECARFQLFGFGGMTDEEEELFAVQGFEGHVRKGHSAFDMGEWADAIKNYEQAWQMALMRNDTKSIPLIIQRILESAVNGGLWSKAIEVQQKLNFEAEQNQDISSLANGLSNIAFFYTQNKEYEKGVLAKKRYAGLTEQYGLYEEEANSIRDIGLIYEHGGNYTKALEFYQTALAKYEDLNLLSGSAQCLKDVGRIEFLYQDNYTEALKVQQRALSMFRKLDDEVALVDALHNLGLTCEKMTNYKQAMIYQKEALQISKSIAQEKLIGLSLQYLANVYWKTGEFQQALEHQTKSLEIFEKLGDEKLLQVGYSTKGLILFSIGQIRQALNLEDDAYQLAKRRDDFVDQATILKNIGMIHQAEGDDETALGFFEQAMNIDSVLSSKRGLAYDYRNLGSINLRLKNLQTAENYIKKAMILSREIEDQRNLAQSLLVLAELDFTNGKNDSAQYYARLSADIAAQLFIPEIEWRAKRKQAQILVKLGKEQEALNAYDATLDVIEKMRSNIKVEEYASGFIDDKIQVYAETIELLVQMKNTDLSFEVAERAKSRNFLDMLGSRTIDFGEQNQQIIAQKDSLQTLITEAQNKIVYYRLETQVKDSLDFWENKLQDYQNQYDDFLEKMRRENAELAEMISVDPMSVDQIQSLIPQETAIIEYFLFGNKLFSWFITANDIRVHQADVHVEKVAENIQQLRKALSQQLSIQIWSKALYNDLIKYWQGDLENIKHIVCVPYGPLHYLPFAVLQDEQDQYLAMKHTLSITPSATVLGFCLKKANTFKHPVNDSYSVLAFGNPSLNDPSLDLPFAAREVKSLNRYYDNIEVFTGKEATLSNFYTNLDDQQLLLFSCHGIFDPVNPLSSALLLAADENYSGWLEAKDIFNLNLNSYLVGMSACETGLSIIRGGDEVVGLSRAFIYAGTLSLLSSLWKVDDLATAVLIKRFYRYLSEGDSRADALQKAQKVVMKEINPYPSYWAAFNITGDFR